MTGHWVFRLHLADGHLSLSGSDPAMRAEIDLGSLDLERLAAGRGLEDAPEDTRAAVLSLAALALRKQRRGEPGSWLGANHVDLVLSADWDLDEAATAGLPAAPLDALGISASIGAVSGAIDAAQLAGA